MLHVWQALLNDAVESSAKQLLEITAFEVMMTTLKCAKLDTKIHKKKILLICDKKLAIKFYDDNLNIKL